MFTAALGYFFRVYLARVLGPEPLGVYALGMTVVGLLGLVGGLGLPWAASRYVSVYRAQGRSKEMWTFLFYALMALLLVNGVLAIGMVAARGQIAKFYHSTTLGGVVPYFAALLVAGILTNFFGQVLVGHKEVARRTVLTSFVAGPATMLITVAFLIRGPTLRGYISAQLCGALLGVLLIGSGAWVITRRQGKFSLAPPALVNRAILSFSLAAFAMDLLGFVTGQVDKVMLGSLLNAREVGIYATAAAIVTFVPMLLQSVNQIFAPVIAELHIKGQRDVLERLFQTLTKWILGFTLPLVFFILMCARPLMRIFGAEFESGWPVLVIGAIGQLVNCATGSVGYLLLMSGNERKLIRVQFGMALVMFVLTLMLVPRWGIVGAACAAAVVNAGMNAWSLYEVKKNLAMTPYNATYWRLLPALLGMAAVTLAVLKASAGWRFEWAGVGLALVAAYVVFTGVALATGLDADDKLVVEAVVGRLRGVAARLEA